MERTPWTKHGWVGTRTYNAWRGMKSRCHNPNSPIWKWYGGRGIKVCPQWNDFPQFLEDMGRATTEKHTLDRIDPNGHYEPGNCRWCTKRQQREHKRPREDTVWLTFRGKTLSVTDWAPIVGIKRKTIYERLKRGWDTESALSRNLWCGISPGGWRKL